MKKLLALFLLIFYLFGLINCQAKQEYIRFLNYGLNVDHVDVFFEDNLKRIWGGTFKNGIGIFDSSGFVQRAEKMSHSGVHCFFQLDETEMLVGTRRGLFKFNLMFHSVSQIKSIRDNEVRGIFRYDSKHIIVFCSNSISIIDIDNDKKIKDWRVEGERMVYVIGDSVTKEKFYVLTNTLNIFDSNLGTLEPITQFHPTYESEIPLFLAYQSHRLWVGTDRGLYSYNLETKKQNTIDGLRGHIVRSILPEPDSNLWIGTDDGIFYMQGEQLIKYRHNPADTHSLLNNCVWSLFRDSNRNIWIGLDYAFSIIPHNTGIKIHRWNDFIDTEEGQRITLVKSDSKGRYWIGGINGLGMYDPSIKQSIYFKHLTPNAIPNNTIRDIYEDYQGNIWICTDGGVAFLNEDIHTFQSVEITDSIGNRSAIWAYGITQTPDSTFWVASVSGGIMGFKVNEIVGGKVKSTLSYNEDYSSDIRFPKEYMQVCRDEKGNLWGNARHSLCRIDKDSRKATLIPIKDGSNLKSCAGHMYFHDDKSIYSIRNNRIDTVNLTTISRTHGTLLDIAPSPTGIWFLTEDILGKYDFNSKRTCLVAQFQKSIYQSCHYVGIDSAVWIGGVDNVLVIKDNPTAEQENIVNYESLISDVTINGQSLTPDDSPSIKSDIAFCDHISLPVGSNNIAFKIGNPVHDKNGWWVNNIVWRVSKLDKEWKHLPNSGELSFNNLPYGTYKLEFALADSLSGTQEIIRSLEFKVCAPWYLSRWFKFIIVAMIAASIALLLLHLHTKQKLKKSELIRKQTVELSKMKMDFMAGISHDLKTPISLIMAPVAKLLKGCRTPATKAGLELIDHNVRKLNEMVMRMIEYTISSDSSLTDQRPKMHLEVNGFMENLIDNAKSDFQSKNIEVKFNASEKCLYTMINPVSLELTINNLLSNALKFTNPQGKLTVTVTDNGDFIGIEVTDTGVGIAAEELPMIFSRFYKGKSNQLYNPEGTGIGLDIVRQNIEEAGGKIEVTSQPDKGTSFFISLPAIAHVRCKNDSEMEGIADTTHGTLLIVDDNPDIARYLSGEMKDMECRHASDGLEGQKIAETWKPDIIVSDLNMPQKNGIDLLKSLKKNLLTRHIPVVILSAKQDSATRIEALKAGASAFVAKPFEMEELYLTIRHLLENNKIKSMDSIIEPSEKETVDDTNKNLDEKFFNLLTKTIEENLDDSNLGVNELAEKMNTNAKNLYRRVKAVTGYAPVEFIRMVRLQKAALLLREPHLTVNEVMYMVGFSTPSYFSKCFAEVYGKTPSAYRQL